MRLKQLWDGKQLKIQDSFRLLLLEVFYGDEIFKNGESMKEVTREPPQ